MLLHSIGPVRDAPPGIGSTGHASRRTKDLVVRHARIAPRRSAGLRVFDTLERRAAATLESDPHT